MSADVDVLKDARIKALRQGIERISGDHSEAGFRLRDALYQAIADVNLGWVTKRTENLIYLAGTLVGSKAA